LLGTFDLGKPEWLEDNAPITGSVRPPSGPKRSLGFSAFHLHFRAVGPLLIMALNVSSERRGQDAGTAEPFPHVFRHTLASQWLEGGGQRLIS
jgi:integrase